MFARPVKAGQPARHCPQQRGAGPVHLAGPGEKVRGDNAGKPGSVAETPPLQQVVRVGFRHLPDVNAERRLHRQAHRQAQIGMADKQVVQFGGGVGDFAQGGGEQILPQPAFYPDGFRVGGAGVKVGQGLEVAPAGGAVRPQVALYVGAAGRQPFQGEQGVVPQPFVQQQPLFRRFQRKVVRRDGAGGAGAGPAQQPVAAVGQHAHPHPFAVGLGLLQVAVQLGDVFRVGFGGAGSADAPLEFDKGIQRREVDGLAAAVGGRVFLYDGVRLGQPGQRQEIPHRAGDVRLRLKVGVAEQDGPRGRRKAPVVNVQMLRFH